MQKVLSFLQSPQFRLKLFLWLVFVSLAIVCAISRSLASFVQIAFVDLLDRADLPQFTRFVLQMQCGGMWLVTLLPWFLYCLVGTLRPAVSVESCLLYAGSAMLAAAIVVLASFIGLCLPFFVLMDKAGHRTLTALF